MVLAAGAGRVGYLLANSAAVQAVGGALITVLLGWAGALVANRKRIAWRAYLDAPINLAPAQVRSMSTRLTFRVYVDEPGQPQAPSEVEVPWLVLLRVRNSGFVPIRGTDFHSPLTFTFPGQEVRGAEVIERSGDSAVQVLPPHSPAPVNPPAPAANAGLSRRLRALVTGPGQGTAVRPGGNGPERTCEVRFAGDLLLNRRDRFTLMVVLSGAPPDTRRKIQQTGSLVGGRIVPEPPRRGPSTRSLLFGGFTALPLAGLLLGLLVSLTPPPGSQCTGGSLKLEGSTAFSPAAGSIASQYQRSCHSAHIGVSGIGSVAGLNNLASAGRRHPKQAAAQIAMSDGPAPAGAAYEPLSGTPLGVIIFTVVVNRDTRVASLTIGQVREIITGKLTNWRQLGGPALPIRVVSRYPDSGSRRAFDKYVLGDATEPQPSSFDCTDRNEIPRARVILCQVAATQALLDNVAGTPGAIGYADSPDVEKFTGQGIQSVELNGLQDSFGNVGNGSGKYPFWTVEYLYTYGTPAPGSLTAKFLGYMGSPAARNLLRLDGYTPCTGGPGKLMSALCSPTAR